MRKSLSTVALLVFTLAACYENPLNAVSAGPFGVNLSGTWVLTSITGAQSPLFPVVPVPPVALGPLPLITNIGSTVNNTTPKTQLDSAYMVMQYDIGKDWTQHLYFTRTDTKTLLQIVTDSVRRGEYFTTTDAAGVTSITISQNTPVNAYFTGVQPYNGGVSSDLKVITVRSGIYGLPTTTVLTPTFAASTAPALADASTFVWIWTKQ